jgi:AcrR family transcriptional regulator
MRHEGAQQVHAASDEQVQRPDDRKRREIMRVAARMFARRPFHEVRLDEIAAATRLGKGTLYVYFASKDDLHTK